MVKTKTGGDSSQLQMKRKGREAGAKNTKAAARSGRESPGAMDPVFDENPEDGMAKHELQPTTKKKKKKKSATPAATKTSTGGKNASERGAQQTEPLSDGDDNASDEDDDDDDEEDVDAGDDPVEMDTDVVDAEDDEDDENDENDEDDEQDEQASPDADDTACKLAQIEAAEKQLRKTANVKFARFSAERLASLLGWDLDATKKLMGQRDSLRKKALRAKRRSETAESMRCAKQCGFNTKAKTIVAASAWDAEKACLSLNDVSRIATDSVRTPDQTSRSSSEFKDRKRIASVKITNAEAKVIASHINPMFLSVIADSIDIMATEKVNVVRPHHVLHALAKRMHGMRFTSALGPNGLIAWAKATNDTNDRPFLPPMYTDIQKRKQWARDTKENAAFHRAHEAQMESEKAERKARREAAAATAPGGD